MDLKLLSIRKTSPARPPILCSIFGGPTLRRGEDSQLPAPVPMSCPVSVTRRAIESQIAPFNLVSSFFLYALSRLNKTSRTHYPTSAGPTVFGLELACPPPQK